MTSSFSLASEKTMSETEGYQVKFEWVVEYQETIILWKTLHEQKSPYGGYKQLKSDYSNILKEHGELQNKLSKQQSYLNKAKTAKKRLEKENQELKEHLDASEAQHKESLAELSKRLDDSNSRLQKKVDDFERELEKLGIDPVTLKPLQGDESEDEQLRKETMNQVKELLEELNSNVENSEAMFAELENIRDQCKTLLNEKVLPDSEGR